MTTELNLTPDSRIEFGFGTVTAGKEEWMYGEYFPAIGPTMAAHGLNILSGFNVVATNFDGITPLTGTLASWPSAAHRAAFHSDPKFVAIEAARDAAMDILSGGHLFQSIDDVITLRTDSDYAVVIAKDVSVVSDPIFALPLTADSAEQTYEGKSLMLRPWSDADEVLLNGTPTDAEVFRVRFSEAK